MHYDEIQALRFQGGCSSVSWAAHRLGLGNLKRALPKPPRPVRFFLHQAARILFQPERDLPEPQLVFRSALAALSELTARALDLVQAFRKMVQERQADGLETWLNTVLSPRLCPWRPAFGAIVRRSAWVELTLEQWAGRGANQPAENDQASDVQPGKFCPTS